MALEPVWRRLLTQYPAVVPGLAGGAV